MPPPAPYPHVPEIRKGDTVVVLSGKDAGKRGTVDRVIRNASAISTCAAQRRQERASRRGYWKPASAAGLGRRRRPQHRQAPYEAAPDQGRTDRMPKIQQGGILDIAKPIASSKVMLVCPNCKEPTRVRPYRPR